MFMGIEIHSAGREPQAKGLKWLSSTIFVLVYIYIAYYYAKSIEPPCTYSFINSILLMPKVLSHLAPNISFQFSLVCKQSLHATLDLDLHSKVTIW